MPIQVSAEFAEKSQKRKAEFKTQQQQQAVQRVVNNVSKPVLDAVEELRKDVAKFNIDVDFTEVLTAVSSLAENVEKIMGDQVDKVIAALPKPARKLIVKRDHAGRIEELEIV